MQGGPRVLLLLLLRPLLLYLRRLLPVRRRLLRLLLGVVPQVVVVPVLRMLWCMLLLEWRAQRAAGGPHLPVRRPGALGSRRLLCRRRCAALLPTLTLQPTDRRGNGDAACSTDPLHLLRLQLLAQHPCIRYRWRGATRSLHHCRCRRRRCRRCCYSCQACLAGR